MVSENFSTVVKYDEISNNYYIEINDSVLEKLHWKIGDKLDFITNKNGTFTITKK
jgi:hypothetical protein